MTYMTREDAYKKRNYTENEIDDINEKWILEQEEEHNGKEKN